MTMASFWDDMLGGPALSGAMSGGLTGLMVGGPVGAAIGGGAGLLGGAYMGYKRDQANEQAKSNQQQLLQNIQAMNRGNYRQHIADLNKSLSFFSVPQQQWDALYGTGAMPTTGTGTWTNTGIK